MSGAAYQDEWATIYVADALEGAKLLDPGSISSIICSPPYWSLRSYLPAEHPDKQREIGAEATPEAWCENLVEVFGALKPALHDTGTLFVVVGDAYCSQGGEPGYKPKDLIGLPFMLAFALRADGWFWRSNTTWCKESAMPESVRDRPSVATEQVLMFSRRPRYFFDQEAVREKWADERNGFSGSSRHRYEGRAERLDGGLTKPPQASGRNIRNWWVKEEPRVTLRSDLTPEQRSYAVGELLRRGLL